MEFKLYSISKKGFLRPRYEIEHDGKILYTVRKKGFSIWNVHGFYDTLGTEVMVIRRRPKLFRLKYELFRNGRHLAYIQREKGAFKNNFIIDSIRHYYFVQGDFSLKSFTISEDGIEVGKISRKPFKRKARYGIALKTDADQDQILGMAIAIEITRSIKRRRKSA